MSNLELNPKEQIGISQGRVFQMEISTGSKGQRCGKNIPWVWRGQGRVVSLSGSVFPKPEIAGIKLERQGQFVESCDSLLRS